MARKAVKRRDQGEGTVRQLPSGRWQARYRDEDGKLRPAPTTFDTKLDAAAWLDAVDEDKEMEAREDPLLRDYATAWLAARELKPRTRVEYRKSLERRILPTFGDVRLSRIRPTRVREWYATLDATKPTQRAHAYSVLRAVLMTAVRDDILQANPCRIEGAGRAGRAIEPKPATLSELDTIVAAIPARYRAMVLLAAWCGLRFGELTELRRRDVVGDVLHVARGVVRVEGEFFVGDPKSHAGKRRVTIPANVLPALRLHLAQHMDSGPDALLFPARNGGHMLPSSHYKVWKRAREAAGRPDLRFHDLRHTQATLAAASGATLAELMARLGHSTSAAAMRYQHAAQDRDRAIAEALAGFAAAGSVGLVAR